MTAPPPPSVTGPICKACKKPMREHSFIQMEKCQSKLIKKEEETE